MRYNRVLNILYILDFFSSCLNYGSCIDLVNTYSCQCRPGYTGSNCEHRISACDSNPCMEGGTCRSVDDISYHCVCPYGFTGRRCEVRGITCIDSLVLVYIYLRDII